MKKIILVLLALTVMASAKFETFKSQTQNIGSPVKTEEVFFGVYTDFSAKLAKGTQDGLTNALIGGIVGGVAMGGVYGIIFYPFIRFMCLLYFLNVASFIGSTLPDEVFIFKYFLMFLEASK